MTPTPAQPPTPTPRLLVGGGADYSTPTDALDPTRREELWIAVRPHSPHPHQASDALAPLVARWLAEAKAEAAAEVRARIEAVAVFRDRVTSKTVYEYSDDIRAALAPLIARWLAEAKAESAAEERRARRGFYESGVEDGRREGAAEVRADALEEAGQLVRDHLFGSVDAERVATFLDSRAARVRATLADPPDTG